MADHSAIECEHDDATWYPAVNEEGWKCLDCGEQLGFRPDLDRSHTEAKVAALLQDFHASKLVYVSNGTMGEIIGWNVAGRCRETNRYDQWSILRFILEDPNMTQAGTDFERSGFWQRRAERWLLGGEPIREGQVELPFARV